MSKKPFVQEYIENRFEEAEEYEAEIARLRAENEHLKAWLETRSEIIEGADANRESWRKEAVRLKAENERLAADKERLVEALKTIISKARGDSVAAHVAVAVIKGVQHD